MPLGPARPCCPAHKLWVSEGPLVSQVTFETADGTLMREARLSRVGVASGALEMRHLVNWDARHNNQEVVVRYQSHVDNKDLKFVTDENGFNPTPRQHRSKLPLNANFFPMPTYAQMSGSKHRFSVLSNRALGVAAEASNPSL